MAQTATTGNLENAQKVIIAAALFTEEHNAPALALIESFSLGKGEKQVTVPKVGQMSMSDLQDGQDIVDEEDIGMTTVDLTASEVGAKVILTDKLVRQSAPNVMSIVGRQLGDGMARKKDTDVQALYTNLNGGTNLGLASKELSAVNLTGCIAYAKSNKFGNKLYVVHHPNAIAEFVKSAAVTPSVNYPVPRGWSEDLLKDFFVGLRPLNGVPVFEAGNIPEDSSGDGIGVIADQGALATLTSVKMRTERERDASLRGTEVVITADYGVFELDDSRGAGLLYNITAPDTTN
ncbi:MAG: hypothetical protein QGI09_11615 [Dehalococcoidia bacterium]|nr:hypothetical protein [Dehalococcoidia bacterium]